MPRLRSRHLTPLLSRTLKLSPISGIFGHRQVGKTTLAETMASEYVSLDDLNSLSESSANPVAFLDRRRGSPLVIDECQLSPQLFPALKEAVRISKKNGQFLLTGSVRFSSRKAIRESLTGRLVAWELLPMDWAEQHNLPLGDSIIRILKSRSIDLKLPSRAWDDADYKRYCEVGGLPGVFAIRDRAVVAQRLETQINTILERDLRLLVETTLSFRTLRNLLVVLAKHHGSPVALTEVRRDTRIAHPTLRRLMTALEALFLIRWMPSEGGPSKPVLFFEDLGERNHLAETPLSQTEAVRAFLYQNLRTQVHYRPELRVEQFQYRSVAGHNIPLCFRADGNVLGIIGVTQESMALAQDSVRPFLKAYPGARVILAGVGMEDRRLSESVRVVAVSQLV